MDSTRDSTRTQGKNTEPKRCPSSPFLLNDLVLSLLSLKFPFCPVLWPFCPVLCLFCPSHKRLKFAGTVLFLLRSRTVNMTKRVCRDCPIPNCGAKYLVTLSNHLTDVHGLDYINRRKWLQEAKLQPKVRVMIQQRRPREYDLQQVKHLYQCKKKKGYNSPSLINTKRNKEIPEISTKRSKEVTEISTKRR